MQRDQEAHLGLGQDEEVSEIHRPRPHSVRRKRLRLQKRSHRRSIQRNAQNPYETQAAEKENEAGSRCKLVTVVHMQFQEQQFLADYYRR